MSVMDIGEIVTQEIVRRVLAAARPDRIGGIAYPAHKYGRVLYEAA